MKNLKELADIGAAAALQELKAFTSPNWCMWVNKTSAGDSWNDEEPTRQAFAKAVRDAVLADTPTPPEPEPYSPTFEAHGFTWTRHKPGEPMPCYGETMVNWLTRHEEAGEPYKHRAEKASNLAWEVPVGWRYADKPNINTKTATKTIPLDINDIRATDEFRRIDGTAIQVLHSWRDDSVMLTHAGRIGYTTLSQTYLRRQHGSTEWKPCTKEVTV